jgi:hypothetical protein
MIAKNQKVCLLLHLAVCVSSLTNVPTDTTTKTWANMYNQVMITTSKKAATTAIKKALVSDLNMRAKLSLIFDQGDDNAIANSKTAPATITQIGKGSLTADNIQPKVIYVTSSSVRETQGSFFKVGIY